MTLADPPSGEHMWWSANEQTWADNSITREIDVPAGEDVRFWMQNTYAIEQDWDFGFVEVSTDGGTTWTQEVVYDESGTQVTTPDDYADPNDSLGFFGKVHGLTGTIDDWRHDYIDLSPYAGMAVQVRLTYATDAGHQERGWFADDFTVTADGAETWSDDVESGENGWVATVDTWFAGTPLGVGWTPDRRGFLRPVLPGRVAYVPRLRQGAPLRLRHVLQRTGPVEVDRFKNNAIGMLVWYRDTSYGELNHVTATTYDLPSVGSKGGLLLVDSTTTRCDARARRRTRTRRP